MKEEIVGFAIAGLVGIALATIIFISADKVPATPLDYEEFENQVNAIQENPDLLLKTVCNINVNGEVITVIFENDECRMTAEYDRNFEILSTSKEDKSVTWLFALVVALGIAFIVGYVGGMIVAVGILLLEIIVAVGVLLLEILEVLIFEIFKKIKAKFQKK